MDCSFAVTALRMILLASVLGFAIPARATLIGDEVSYELFNSNDAMTQDGSFTVIMGSSELTYGFPLQIYDLDVEESTVKITQNGADSVSSGAHRVRLSDLDWVGVAGEIVGATVSENTTAFGDVILSFGAHELEIDLLAFTSPWLRDQHILIALEVAHQVDGGAVPAPSTIVLFILGLLAVGYRALRGLPIPGVDCAQSITVSTR